MQDSAPPVPTDLTHPEPPTIASGTASTPVRSALGPRWKLWLSLLAVVVALRVAAPLFLGPLIEARLSRVLGTPVDVGDVSFAPLDAVVILRHVTVQAPGATSDADDSTPVIAADRVRIDVQWLPLLHRSFLVRELAIESARIDLERVDGAGASLESLLRADPATELPPDWTFALDRIVLRDTQVRLRGLGDAHPGPLEVGVRDAQFATRRRRASVFGRAPNLRVDAVVEGGRVRIDGTSDLRDDGVLIDTLVRVKDVPLTRLNPYLADLGWSAFTGRVSGHLRYQRDPGRRDLVTGRLQARRIAVQVPALAEPALTVRRAVAEIGGIDLLQRRAAIGSLRLHGARLAVRPDLAAPLPLLDGVAFAPGAARRKQPQVQPVAASERVAPWSWTIGHVATPFARLHVAGRDGVVTLAASVAAESLGPGAYWSPLRAWIGRGDGVVTFDGTARLTRGLVIDGRLTADGVDAPTFARAVGVPFAELAQAGRGAADLTVEIEPGATKAPPLDVRGKITLTDPWLAGPAGEEFALGAGAVELTLAGIDVARSDGRTVAPTEVRIADAVVSAPYALLTRTPAGWLLPSFDAAPAERPGGRDPGSGDRRRDDGETGLVPAAAAAPVAAATKATGATATTANTAATANTATTATPGDVAPARLRETEFVVAALRSRGGRVLLVDQGTLPATTFDVALVEAWAQELRLRDATLGNFVVQGTDPRFGALQLGGSRSVGRREIEVFAQSVPLAAAAPYLQQAGLPYRFTSGTGSFLSRVTFADGRWNADTTLTLREPSIDGDDAELRQALGMPADAALAALRDPDGDVMLRLPLSSASADDARALPDMVASAVREAVGRARKAPLPEVPIQIVFPPGRAELSVQGARQLASIAEVLAARRDVVVELSGALSSADRRWLAEQELAADLDEPDGFMGVLRALGVRDRRERIRDALEARAEGRPGWLDADDEAVVDRLIAEGPPVSDHRLAALAAARLTRVASTLSSDHAVTPARVVIADPPGRVSSAAPVVRARIGVDARAPGLARLEAGRW